MTPRQQYTVTVALRDQDSTAALLSLVSVLHRRAVEVDRAELSPASHGRRIFTATFTAGDRQAVTVRATLDNLVVVLDSVLVNAREDPAALPHSSPRRNT